MTGHSKPRQVWTTEAQRQLFRERRYPMMREVVYGAVVLGMDPRRSYGLYEAINHAEELRDGSPARMEALAGQSAAKRFSMAVEEKVTMLEQDVNVIDAIRAEIDPDEAGYAVWDKKLQDLREVTTLVEQSQIFRPFASGKDSERALKFIEPEVALRMKVSHAIDWSRSGLRLEQSKVLGDKAEQRIEELRDRASEIVSSGQLNGVEDYFGIEAAMNEEADLASMTEWTTIQPGVSGDYLVSLRDTSHASRSMLMALDKYASVKVLEGRDRSEIDSSPVWNKVVSAPAMAGVVRPNGRDAVGVALGNNDPKSTFHRMLDYRQTAFFGHGAELTFDPYGPFEEQTYVDPDVVLGRGGSGDAAGRGKAGSSPTLRSGLARAEELNAEGVTSQEEAQMG